MTESSLNPKAVGDDGKSFGLMQIQVSTVEEVGFKGTKEDFLKPKINLLYSILYLRKMLKNTGNIWKALDAYNRGLKNTKKYPYTNKWKNHPHVGKIIKAMKLKSMQRKCK